MVSCCFMSPDEVQPIRGSTARARSRSSSSCHSLVLALPDCIAFLAGLKMRAVMVGPRGIGGSQSFGGRRRDSIETPFGDLIGDSRPDVIAFLVRYSHYAAL